mmetsp:Transcript_11839/g.27197  ORF Transcript_11839/g.27197 Transcript_11839/m.27197 type:complete len:325 (+) Transcript_11839:1127-2101(+)
MRVVQNCADHGDVVLVVHLDGGLELLGDVVQCRKELLRVGGNRELLFLEGHVLLQLLLERVLACLSLGLKSSHGALDCRALRRNLGELGGVVNDVLRAPLPRSELLERRRVHLDQTLSLEAVLAQRGSLDVLGLLCHPLLHLVDAPLQASDLQVASAGLSESLLGLVVILLLSLNKRAPHGLRGIDRDVLGRSKQRRLLDALLGLKGAQEGGTRQLLLHLLRLLRLLVRIEVLHLGLRLRNRLAKLGLLEVRRLLLEPRAQFLSTARVVIGHLTVLAETAKNGSNALLADALFSHLRQDLPVVGQLCHDGLVIRLRALNHILHI